MVVRDAREVVYQGRSDGYGQVFRLGAGPGKLNVRFESLPIRDSAISISFCIMDRNTAEVFDWRRNQKLPMEWDGECTGRLAPRVDWSCEEVQGGPTAGSGGT